MLNSLGEKTGTTVSQKNIFVLREYILKYLGIKCHVYILYLFSKVSGKISVPLETEERKRCNSLSPSVESRGRVCKYALYFFSNVGWKLFKIKTWGKYI